jgi:hypothetical protein
MRRTVPLVKPTSDGAICTTTCPDALSFAMTASVRPPKLSTRSQSQPPPPVDRHVPGATSALTASVPSPNGAVGELVAGPAIGSHGAQRDEVNALSVGAIVTMAGPVALSFARISSVVPATPCRRAQ